MSKKDFLKEMIEISFKMRDNEISIFEGYKRLRENFERNPDPVYTPLIKIIGGSSQEKLNIIYSMDNINSKEIKNLKKISGEYLKNLNYLINKKENEQKRLRNQNFEEENWRFILFLYNFSPENFLSSQENYNLLIESMIKDKSFQENLYLKSGISAIECDELIGNLSKIGGLEKKFAERFRNYIDEIDMEDLNF
jgi:hypothetical protein